MSKKILIFTIIFCFFLTTLGLICPIACSADAELLLPAPGSMVNITPAYVPVIVKGLRVHPENPILFDFIVDTGNSGLTTSSPELKSESERLIKYFLASLTIPEDDLWVNLSPYEKDRVIPDQLGQTEMGRDMLAEDYILKQLTASLIYPEKDLGKKFWNRVYSKAQQVYGSTQVPVNTFNKVWIVADKAKVYVHDNTAFIVASHLKVMLEEDYLAMQKHNVIPKNSVILSPSLRSRAGSAKDLKTPLDSSAAPQNDVNALGSPNRLPSEIVLNAKAPQGNNSNASPATSSLGSQIIRAIILPELEKEVNSGKNFANLRQIFHSMILAAWYKKNLKQALLNQVYSNKSKINGVDVADKTIKEQIYQQYLKAYKKGVFNYIKEDIQNGQTVPRKYFSGGLQINAAQATEIVEADNPAVLKFRARPSVGDLALVSAVTPEVINVPNAAMRGYKNETIENLWQIRNLLNDLAKNPDTVLGLIEYNRKKIIEYLVEVGNALKAKNAFTLVAYLANYRNKINALVWDEMNKIEQKFPVDNPWTNDPKFIEEAKRTIRILEGTEMNEEVSSFKKKEGVPTWDDRLSYVTYWEDRSFYVRSGVSLFPNIKLVLPQGIYSKTRVMTSSGKTISAQKAEELVSSGKGKVLVIDYNARSYAIFARTDAAMRVQRNVTLIHFGSSIFRTKTEFIRLLNAMNAFGEDLKDITLKRENLNKDHIGQIYNIPLPRLSEFDQKLTYDFTIEYGRLMEERKALYLHVEIVPIVHEDRALELIRKQISDIRKQLLNDIKRLKKVVSNPAMTVPTRTYHMIASFSINQDRYRLGTINYGDGWQALRLSRMDSTYLRSNETAQEIPYRTVVEVPFQTNRIVNRDLSNAPGLVTGLVRNILKGKNKREGLEKFLSEELKTIGIEQGLPEAESPIVTRWSPVKSLGLPKPLVAELERQGIERIYNILDKKDILLSMKGIEPTVQIIREAMQKNDIYFEDEKPVEQNKDFTADTPISKLPLGIYVHILERQNIKTIGKLTEKTYWQVMELLGNRIDATEMVRRALMNKGFYFKPRDAAMSAPLMPGRTVRIEFNKQKQTEFDLGIFDDEFVVQYDEDLDLARVETSSGEMEEVYVGDPYEHRIDGETIVRVFFKKGNLYAQNVSYEEVTYRTVDRAMKSGPVQVSPNAAMTNIVNERYSAINKETTTLRQAKKLMRELETITPLTDKEKTFINKAKNKGQLLLILRALTPGGAPSSLDTSLTINGGRRIKERDRLGDHDRNDQAMRGPGGIDLNSRNMQLDGTGEKINIKFDKATIAQFQSGDFLGVRPVIMSITPIINVLPLLGLKENDRLAGL